MTLTIQWWHIPTLLTFLWVAFAAFPSRGGWDDYAKFYALVICAVLVLAVWVLFMAWRIAA